ncbi:MAG: hypothetical protein GF411_20500 [Candidatus Lokiarchaeota archaeon]|nr:hypothetical protein [Candidatus Lokiarchaeota archaeon]
MAISHNKTARQKKDVTETIVTDDLASAIRELRSHSNEQDFSDCYSIEDICNRLGENYRNARNIIKDCMANGTCEYAGKRRGRGIDGRITKTPVYRFKFKNKKK